MHTFPTSRQRHGTDGTPGCAGHTVGADSRDAAVGVHGITRRKGTKMIDTTDIKLGMALIP
jgi:hypothetical protein